MTASVPDEILQNVNELRWIPLTNGIEFRLLFASDETGRWTVLFRCQPGSFISRHKHYGAGEYYVIKGRMEYRMGSAPAGSYGYEPIGVIHDRTTFPEYTELLFTNFGPVVFLNEDDSVVSILDQAVLRRLAAAA
jgi:anti-sigma factor ChrR (cupin superfamily)